MRLLMVNDIMLSFYYCHTFVFSGFKWNTPTIFPPFPGQAHSCNTQKPRQIIKIIETGTKYFFYISYFIII